MSGGTKVTPPSCIPDVLKAFGRVVMTPNGPEPKQPLGEYEVS